MGNSFVQRISRLDQFGKKVVRFGIVLVFIWIGGLKFFDYEAEGIVPFVANSPFMSFFYTHPGEYKNYTNKEGELIEKNYQWHHQNNSYGFSKGLGTFLLILAVMVALHGVAQLTSMVGSILVIIVTIGTLSFLITTPESWVPHLNGHQGGFPFLSARGRLVIKDIVILGAAIITMSESAQLYLARKSRSQHDSRNDKNNYNLL